MIEIRGRAANAIKRIPCVYNEACIHVNMYMYTYAYNVNTYIRVYVCLHNIYTYTEDFFFIFKTTYKLTLYTTTSTQRTSRLLLPRVFSVKITVLGKLNMTLANLRSFHLRKAQFYFLFLCLSPTRASSNLKA